MRQLLPEPGHGEPDLDRVYAWPEGRCVRVNFVSSIDGAATVDGLSGGLSSGADREVFHHLRATCEVVLVGAGTARAERYRPAKVPIAVVSNRLSVDVADRLFSAVDGAARPIVLTAASASPERRAPLEDVADVVAAGERAVDLEVALAELDRRGYRRVLCEGGPTLFGELAEGGLVNELCLTIAPQLAIGDGPRITRGRIPMPPVDARLLTVLENDGELLLRYAVG